MKRYDCISDDEKWSAVVNCDKKFDGQFFYGVKTTGIFCRPSCRAKTPVRANVVFFDDAAKAMETGFRPCKRCCPDKMVFEPDKELAKKVKDMLDENYDKTIDLNFIAKSLGASTNHLAKVFKQYYTFSPVQYITNLRVDKSAKLLAASDINILEIAYMTGFKSLSNFYKCFKERIGQTPNEYRKGGREA